MENSTDELKCFLKFLSKWDNNCTSVESLQWGDPWCLKESKGNICECLIQVLRVQKTWWVRLYFIWSGSIPKSNETTEEAKDMLCVDTYPLWHLNFLGSSTHDEMWALEMRYTHIWILDYAVIAKCYVDAADEKNLLPIHRNIRYDWNAFVIFQKVISNPPEIFSFLCPSGDCHLHPCIFIRWGNNSFHMLREWKLPHRPFLTHVADHTFSLGDRVSHSGVNFRFCNGMSRE